MSRDGSVQKQSGLYQTMTPIFCYSHLKTVNLTCVQMGLVFPCVHPSVIIRTPPPLIYAGNSIT